MKYFEYSSVILIRSQEYFLLNDSGAWRRYKWQSC